jgi:hypothetical protein
MSVLEMQMTQLYDINAAARQLTHRSHMMDVENTLPEVSRRGVLLMVCAFSLPKAEGITV